MTAALLIEAIDTFFAILDAILAWIAVIAFVATVFLLTTVAAVAHGWTAVRRRITRRSWARGPIRARIYTRTRRKRPNEPTEAPAYEEAA